MNNQPDVIILYGPPGSGKGTQAHLLRSSLSWYAHLDFGTQIRGYMHDHQHDTGTDGDRVAKMKATMDEGHPLNIKDLKYIVERDILMAINAGKPIILEGPGRMLEEVQWLSEFFRAQSLRVCIIHLLLTLEDILPRLQTRWYVPGLGQPFDSYDHAKAACKPGKIPYRRDDDDNIELITERYRTLYKDNFEDFLFIYQNISQADIIIFDASKPIDSIHTNIISKLDSQYNFQYDFIPSHSH